MSDFDRIRPIGIAHLVTFTCVVEERSFTRAAARLGYTQSAVSHQLARLEDVVGQRLLARRAGGRGVEPTAAGERLASHARSIIDRMQLACAELDALGDEATLRFRLGTFQTASSQVLPPILRALADREPAARVQLSESADLGFLLHSVERGELDLTFAFQPLPEGPFEAIEVHRDRYVLLVPDDSPLIASAAPPSLEEISALPLITWRTTLRHPDVENPLLARGYEPEVILRTDDSDTVRALVAAGVGVAIVPSGLAHGAAGAVGLPLDDGIFGLRILVLVWHRDRHLPAIATRFLELAAALARAREGA